MKVSEKKYLIFIISLIILIPSISYSDNKPVIFFSDLTSGPKTGWEGSSTKGAAVTIWGYGFGSTRGNSYVQVGNVKLTTDSDYAEWGATDNNPNLMKGVPIQRITFWLNNSMQTGNTFIKVVVNGNSSNEINFTVRDSGRIYFIDKNNGDNNNDGQYSQNKGNWHGPWKNFYKADPEENSVLSPGDIVYVRYGYYDVIDGDGRLIKLYGKKDGSNDLPYSIIGYPGDKYPVLIEPIVNVVKPSDGGSQANYYIFAKLYYSGPQKSIFHIYGNGWRIVGNYFNLTSPSAVFKSGTIKIWWGKDIYILGNVFKGGGYDYYAHHVYGTCGYANEDGGNLENVYIGYNEVFNWQNNKSLYKGGAAWNFRQNSDYDNPPVVIDRIYIFNNYMHDSPYAQFFYTEETNSLSYYLYNNIIEKVNYYGYGTADANIFSSSNGAKIYIYNNIFFDTGKAESVIHLKYAQGFSSNNIYISDGSYNINFIATDGAKIYSNNDLFFGSDLPSGSNINITNPITADPLFVNASAGDFHLQSNSPAIDAGISIPEVTTDFDGNPRPMDGDGDGVAKPDIGAYEYTGTYIPPQKDTTPPAPPQNPKATVNPPSK